MFKYSKIYTLHIYNINLVPQITKSLRHDNICCVIFYNYIKFLDHLFSVIVLTGHMSTHIHTSTHSKTHTHTHTDTHTDTHKKLVQY